jgi:hypothetical protein
MASMPGRPRGAPCGRGQICGEGHASRCLPASCQQSANRRRRRPPPPARRSPPGGRDPPGCPRGVAETRRPASGRCCSSPATTAPGRIGRRQHPQQPVPVAGVRSKDDQVLAQLGQGGRRVASGRHGAPLPRAAAASARLRAVVIWTASPIVPGVRESALRSTVRRALPVGRAGAGPRPLSSPGPSGLLPAGR